MKLLKIARYILVFCFVSTALPAMEELPPDIMEESHFSLLPHELFDIIILARLSDCNNIHENLQAVAYLYQVSKYFKKYFDEHYPELMFVLHGIDPDDKCYKDKIEKTKKFLAERNLFINTRSTRAQTLLHRAAWHSKSKVFKTLLSLGANYKLLDCLNYSVYTIEKEKKCSKIEECLKRVINGINEIYLKDIEPLVQNSVYSKALFENDFKAFEQWLGEQTQDSISDKNDIYDWLVRTVESRDRLKQYFDKINKLGLVIDLEEVVISACEVNNSSAFDYFLKQDVVPDQDSLSNLLRICIDNNSTSIIPSIKSYNINRGGGFDVNYADNKGVTALMLAAQRGHTEFAQRLIQCSATIDAIDNDGTTALMWAASTGHTEVAQLLIKCDAPVDATNSFKQTALMLAARNGHLEVVQLLIGSGAIIDLADSEGKTALIWAAMSCRPQVVQLLIDSGAAINATDSDGKTALEWAKIALEFKKKFSSSMPAEITDCSKIIELLSEKPSAIEDLTNKVENLDL